MKFQIQDDIIRRALDFFGLRGVVPHEYEATVVPVTVIGDLDGPTIVQRFTNVTDGSPFCTVPQGESWRLLSVHGLHTQSAATTAVQTILVAQVPEPVNTHRFAGFTDIAAAVEQLRITFGLNLTNHFLYRMPPKTIIGPNSRVFFANFQGDGTITSTGVVVYQRLGEKLVDLQ